MPATTTTQTVPSSRRHRRAAAVPTAEGESAEPKRCVVCNESVDHVWRARGSEGTYRCRSCYKVRKKERVRTERVRATAKRITQVFVGAIVVGIAVYVLCQMAERRTVSGVPSYMVQ